MSDGPQVDAIAAGAFSRSIVEGTPLALAELEELAQNLEQWAQRARDGAKLGARVIGTNEVQLEALTAAKVIRRNLLRLQERTS